MSKIRSHQKRPSAHLLALLAVLPTAGYAQQAETTLPTVTVRETADVPYKADKSANPKITQPLLDTPKTIQIIKKETLEEQGALTLMEALRNTPGITMQLGEGGSTAAGDTFQLRGSAMQQSTYVDGIRDLGAVTRDTFNLEQVEVIKGAAGAETGRSAATGYINLISKQAHIGDESSVSATVGTANKKRVSADINRELNETSAIRINAMAQDSGVDGRDKVKNSGQGLAISYAAGLGTGTRFNLYSQHIRQNNIPDGGQTTIGMDGYYNSTASTFANGGARASRNNFYGSSSDFEKVSADMITAKVEHDLGEGTTLRNITRFGRTQTERLLTAVGAVTASSSDTSTWTVALSRQGLNQTNTIAANQTSLSKAFSALGMNHSLVTGVEVMQESQESRTASASGTGSVYSPNPDGSFPSVDNVSPTWNRGKMSTLGVYATDTAKINEQYSLFGSSRVDHYRLDTTNVSSTNVTADMNDTRTLLSWSLGAVYKPAPNGSIYTSYADSKTPPGGDNLILSPTSTNQSNATLDPQTTRTVELGSKWDLLDKRLNVAGALFYSTNEGQTSYDRTTLQLTQFGKTIVKGVELSTVGQLTRFWQVSAGVARTMTQQVEQNSSSGVSSDLVRWSPELTATAWTSYQLDKLTLGLGARHVSEQRRVITEGTSLSTSNMPAIPSYTVYDTMATYQINTKTSLRLNVYNLFDKEYISTLNNNGNRVVLGAPRSAALTLNVKF